MSRVVRLRQEVLNTLRAHHKRALDSNGKAKELLDSRLREIKQDRASIARESELRERIEYAKRKTDEMRFAVEELRDEIEATSSLVSKRQVLLADCPVQTPSASRSISRGELQDLFRTVCTEQCQATNALLTTMLSIKIIEQRPPKVFINNEEYSPARPAHSTALLCILLQTLSTILGVRLRHPVSFAPHTVDPIVSDVTGQGYRVVSPSKVESAKASRLLWLDARQLVACSGADLESADNPVIALESMCRSHLLNIGSKAPRHRDILDQLESFDGSALACSPYMNLSPPSSSIPVV
ncbi:hypothetical protein J8273_7913 [Carpediemonas membranifera]|uniref:Uncharacterized protein n=1 Tax=Carpediemonas membranifera TaxID=201153 RepID=A0A8J6E1F5_9EUKA|nr:hypothetical protein J8273_7913 [Carpediemonas membranifera]|eukprot:KAG9390562.1 hypothetical protein J8273_7913 [Carpediemonas membranifera]